MANIYRVSYELNVNSQIMASTFHYQTDVSVSGSEPSTADVLDGVDSLLTTAYRAMLPTPYQLTQLKLRQEVTPGSGDVPLSRVKVKNVAGTLAVSPQDLPVSVCGLISRTTDAAIRAGRGHVFTPPIRSSSYLSGGALLTSGALWTAMQAFAALLDDSFDLGAVNPTHVNPVIYSRARNARGQDPFTFEVTGAAASSRVRWLDSRVVA